MKGNLLIAQAGGPSSVLNATLFGVIEEAKRHGEIDGIIGAIRGAGGILEENFVDLRAQSREFLERLPYTPASVIGTSRRSIFPEEYPRINDILKKYKVKYLLYNGGNGSMGTCCKMYKAADDEIKIIGIPKTIDNDINVIDHAPGFASAARYMAVTTREIAEDVKSMPIHVCIIESMGRNAGWIAASSILARKNPGNGPHLVYVPERPFMMDEFLEDVRKMYERIGGVVVVVSEGIVDEKGKPVVPPLVVPGGKDPFPGDVGVFLAQQVWQKLGIKSRAEKPGIAARASAAHQSPIDREEAINVGIAAVRAAVEGKSGYMVGLERVSSVPYKCNTTLVPLQNVSNVEKKLPDIYINNKGNDINLEFLDYVKPLVGDLPDFAELKLIRNLK